MALTAHKTVTQFMAYVHAEDDPVRAAAEKVATLRRGAIDGHAPAALPKPSPVVTDDDKTRTSLGNYRPFRHRKAATRAVPPDSKRAAPNLMQDQKEVTA